jgi:broad specificity phosphatase PhoE
MADAFSADQDLPTGVPVRAGIITLVRHGEPALSRKVRFNCQAYGEWWARYEVGGLKPDQDPPPTLVEIARAAEVVLVSTRRRSIESARAICDGRAFAVDDLFVEAPLPPPPWPAWIRMSPKELGFFARFWWWFFDHHAGQETRAQAEARAEQAAVVLIERSAGGHDVVLVAHGFFNWMVARALEKKGLRRVVDEGHGYWSVKRLART